MTAVNNKRQVFIAGVRDGIPIGLGYFAVSFSLGILAKSAGLTPIQAALTSFLNNASAGQYIGFTLIKDGASYWALAIATLVTNARYLLMSCAMSQRMDPKTPFYHRLFMSFDITDEIFGIMIASPGYLKPIYMYGAMAVALPGWAVGTALGTLAGSILPLRLVSALSVALYGMFIAIVIPPAKQEKVVAALVLISFGASWAFASLPGVSALADGTRTIILTVVISAGAALLFPRKTDEEAGA